MKGERGESLDGGATKRINACHNCFFNARAAIEAITKGARIRYSCPCGMVIESPLHVIVEDAPRALSRQAPTIPTTTKRQWGTGVTG